MLLTTTLHLTCACTCDGSNRHPLGSTADIRKRAWLHLVGVRDKAAAVEVIQHPTTPTEEQDDEKQVDEKELDLIRRDAGRSLLHRYCRRTQTTPNSPDISAVSLAPSGEQTSQWSRSFTDLQTDLASVLVRCVSNPLGSGQAKLHYYQGLHDIAGVLMYNLADTDLTCAVLRRICQSHMRDALREDFSGLTWLLDHTALPLIEQYDEEVHAYLRMAEVSMANCILPWMITWFTHDIEASSVSSRLADAFVASHPLFPLYFAVALILHPTNREEILEAECDQAMVHMTMLRFAKRLAGDWDTSGDGIPAQDIIESGIAMM